MSVYHYPPPLLPPSCRADTARTRVCNISSLQVAVTNFFWCSDSFLNVICVFLLKFLHCFPGLPQCMFGRVPEEVVSFYSQHDCSLADQHQLSPCWSENLWYILQMKFIIIIIIIISIITTDIVFVNIIVHHSSTDTLWLWNASHYQQQSYIQDHAYPHDHAPPPNN